MFGELIKSFGEALIPVKRLDEQGIMRALKHPLKYKKLVLDEKQSHIIYLDPLEIKIIGGIEMSNVLVNPEIGKGWLINKTQKSKWRLSGKRAYICHPDIPYALELDMESFYNQAKVGAKLRAMLGLPKQWIQLQTDALCMMAISHWNAGFDERPGSVMIFLFGFAIGGVVIMLIVFLLIIVMGIFT